MATLYVAQQTKLFSETSLPPGENRFVVIFRNIMLSAINVLNYTYFKVRTLTIEINLNDECVSSQSQKRREKSSYSFIE